MKPIHVEDLLRPIHQERSRYLLDFFARNSKEIEETNALVFAPYQYSIQTREDFYAKANLSFELCPVERDSTWLLAEDFDRIEAELFLSKRDGHIFYKDIRSEPIEVAHSFSEMWTGLGQSVSTEPDEDVSIDEETQTALKACFSREAMPVIEKIYERIHDECGGDNVDCMSESQADSLLYERGCFCLQFPFTKARDKRLQLPEEGDWWILGFSGGDEDVSSDNGTLFLDAQSGQIFLCELLPDWFGKSFFQLMLDELLPSFLRPKKPYTKTWELVADSFEEWITRLEQHGWKPSANP